MSGLPQNVRNSSVNLVASALGHINWTTATIRFKFVLAQTFMHPFQKFCLDCEACNFLPVGIILCDKLVIRYFRAVIQVNALGQVQANKLGSLSCVRLALTKSLASFVFNGHSPVEWRTSMSAQTKRPITWKGFRRFSRHNSAWKVPWGFVEYISSLVAARISRLRLVPALEYLGKLGLLLALLSWFYPGCIQRKQSEQSAKQAAADAKKSRHYVAWQTINSALGKPGNGGRADALNDLNQDGIRLDGISLSGGVILVNPLNLTNARMTHADFSQGQYEGVNFSGVAFDSSKWDNTFSHNCNFQGASFWDVMFKGANFTLCDFGLLMEKNAQRPSIFLPPSPGVEGTRFNLCNFAGAQFPMGCN
jgi:hypothetical protein